MLITCMRLLHVCTYYVYTKPVYYVYRDQRSLNTTGLQCMRFSPVACNLGKLNAGAKILLHACNTRIHVHERAGLGRGSTCTYTCVYMYV